MTKTETSLDLLCINTIRTLSMAAVQKANSGHPGTPMALAPLGYLLFTRHLRYNPQDPSWTDRDRFILSAGHASMLLYSLLFLSGYDLSLDDIRNFRQWQSKTPGHPEYGHTPGVETTTGPLGQGFANGGRNGAGGSPSGGAVRPWGRWGGRPPHLCDLLGWRPDWKA